MTARNAIATAKPPAAVPAARRPRSPWALTWRGTSTVASMEFRQRLRGTGWRAAVGLWLLAILIMAVTITFSVGLASDGWLFAAITAMTGLAGMATAAVVATRAMARVFTGPAMSALLGTRLSPLEIVVGKLGAAWLSACALLALALPMLLYSAIFEDVSAGRAFAAVGGLTGAFAVTAATAGGAATALAHRAPTALISTGTCLLLLTAGPTCAALLDEVVIPRLAAQQYRLANDSATAPTGSHPEAAASQTADTDQTPTEGATESGLSTPTTSTEDGDAAKASSATEAETGTSEANNTGGALADHGTESGVTVPEARSAPSNASQCADQPGTTDESAADQTWWLWSASPAVVVVDAINYPQPAATKAAKATKVEPTEPDPLAEAKHHIRVLRAGREAVMAECLTGTPTWHRGLASVWPYGATVLGGVAIGGTITAVVRVGRPLRRHTRRASPAPLT